MLKFFKQDIFKMKRSKAALLLSLASACLSLISFNSLSAYFEDKEAEWMYFGRHHHSDHDSQDGAIIPYGSAGSLDISTKSSGDPANATVITFGSWDNSLAFESDGSIIISSNGYDDNYAFSMPRDGVLTGMAAYLANQFTDTAVQGITATIFAQVYISTTPNDVFYPVPDATIVLSPNYPDLLSNSGIASGVITDLHIPLSAGTRVAYVFFMTSSGLADNTFSINVELGGGLAIR